MLSWIVCRCVTQRKLQTPGTPVHITNLLAAHVATQLSLGFPEAKDGRSPTSLLACRAWHRYQLTRCLRPGPSQANGTALAALPALRLHIGPTLRCHLFSPQPSWGPRLSPHSIGKLDQSSQPPPTPRPLCTFYYRHGLH